MAQYSVCDIISISKPLIFKYTKSKILKILVFWMKMKHFLLGDDIITLSTHFSLFWNLIQGQLIPINLCHDLESFLSFKFAVKRWLMANKNESAGVHLDFQLLIIDCQKWNWLRLCPNVPKYYLFLTFLLLATYFVL